MFTQDKTEEFDWTRHSAATRDTKYTPNTGPSSDRSGSKQGMLHTCHLVLNQNGKLNIDRRGFMTKSKSNNSRFILSQIS